MQCRQKEGAYVLDRVDIWGPDPGGDRPVRCMGALLLVLSWHEMRAVYPVQTLSLHATGTFRGWGPTSQHRDAVQIAVVCKLMSKPWPEGTSTVELVVQLCSCLTYNSGACRSIAPGSAVGADYPWPSAGCGNEMLRRLADSTGTCSQEHCCGRYVRVSNWRRMRSFREAGWKQGTKRRAGDSRCREGRLRPRTSYRDYSSSSIVTCFDIG